MVFSIGIVVLVMGSIHQCSALNVRNMPADDFFNLTFSMCDSCVDKCFEDQPKLTDINIRQCKCDHHCVIFGDCCLGFYTFCNIFLHPSATIEFIKSKRDREKQTEEEKNISDFTDKAQCELFIASMSSEVNLLAITACPVEYPEGDIKDKCTGNQTAFPIDIPVSIPALPYWLFKNVYCALCHNFTLDDVLYWQAEIQCFIRLADDITTVEQFTDYIPDAPCRTFVSLPDDSIKVRFCDPDLQPRCSEIKQDLPNSPPTTTVSLSQTSNESLTDLNVLPSDLPNNSIAALTQANLDVLCNAYMYEYHDREDGDSTRYFNPHCRACEVGWHNFNRPEIIECEFFVHGPFYPIPMGSRLVRFMFGIYEKYIYFFSTESKSLLESSHTTCSAEKYFEFVTKSCELFPCQQGFFPYYQNCIPTFQTINATTSINYPLQSTVYVKTNIVLLMDGEKTFQQVTNYVVDNIAESRISAYRPENIYHPTILPLNIKVNSLEIVRVGKIISLKNGVVEFVSGLVKADLEIPVLFNDLNQTISNLRASSMIQSENTLVSNYPENMRLDCYNSRPKTYKNLDLNLLHKRAFVEIDGVMVDLVETKFTLLISHLSPIQVLTVDVCRPLLSLDRNHENIQGQNFPKTSEQCDNLTSELSHFSVVNGSLKFSDTLIIPHGDFFINGDKVDICSRALKGNTPLLNDRSLRTKFKNISSAASMVLKVLAFIISLISRDDNPGTVYFQSLGITCTLIDFIHLLENLSFHNSGEILAVLLHLAWLLVAYSLGAWCMNMVCCNTKSTLKCLSRHLFMSVVVPVFTIVVCATGDVNTPPWDIGYGSTGKILSAKLKVILYGYIIPFALGIIFVLVCHIYRIARRKSLKKNKSFYSCHILITGILTLQFGFGCSESLSKLSIYYFLYLASSVLVAWSFLLIACHGLRKPKSRLSNPSRYLQSTNDNPHSVPIQSKPQEQE